MRINCRRDGILQFALIESVDNIPYLTGGACYYPHAAGLQRLESIGSDIPANNRSGAVIDHCLGSLDACTAACREGWIAESLDIQRFGVDEKEVLTPPEPWVDSR